MELEPFLDCLILVDNLFSHWKLHFGSKLKDRQDLDVQTAKQWAAALVMMEVTEIEVETAFLKSLTHLWPPTTPADFLELVRSNHTSQFPEAYTAYTQAANGTYLHPVCHETAVRVGLWNMRNANEYITRRAWNEIYPQVCDEYSQDSAKFEPNAIAIERKREIDTPVLAAPKKLSESQIKAAMSAIEKIREMI